MNDIVTGQADEKFAHVKAEFERNFSERNELGASLCISVNGETVVDLWGGVADEKNATAWQENTLTPVFSCTKAATALCAHLLIDRGELQLEAPVSRYWPEFAKAGKERTTVQMMLNHESGVPALREKVPAGGFRDWEYITGRLAAEAPFWEPGTRNGYHLITFGWTVGELVRRVSGQSLGQFFKEQIADPLDAEFWIGLPDSADAPLAKIVPWQPRSSEPLGEFTEMIMAEPKSIPSLSFLNTGGWSANSRDDQRAEIGGAGGMANARGIMRMYEPLAMGGCHNGVSLVSPQQLQRMNRVSTATQRDATLLIPTRFASGFMKSMDNRGQELGTQKTMILGDQAFGHSGAGGSVGFADPECGLAFSYTMNRMGAGLLLNERGQSLVDTTYQALGYRSNTSGCWAK